MKSIIITPSICLSLSSCYCGTNLYYMEEVNTQTKFGHIESRVVKEIRSSGVFVLETDGRYNNHEVPYSAIIAIEKP